MENIPLSSKTNKWKRPSTGKELLDSLMNDDDSEKCDFTDLGEYILELDDDMQEQVISKENENNDQRQPEENKNDEQRQLEDNGNNDQRELEENEIINLERSANERK
ncbi:hypothetical protein JTB14_019555 [Gonioctena quinquepunctata]|nr:hypothetical protein JTB14_019555 [Gonioctena quinquepunctata]